MNPAEMSLQTKAKKIQEHTSLACSAGPTMQMHTHSWSGSSRQKPDAAAGAALYLITPFPLISLALTPGFSFLKRRTQAPQLCFGEQLLLCDVKSEAFCRI